MSSGAVLKKQFGTKIRKADGTIVWEGYGFIMNPFEAKANNNLTLGAAVFWNTVVSQSPSAAGTTAPLDQVYGVGQVSGVTNAMFCGVALETVSSGGFATIAGVGSVLNVNSLASASLTNNAVKAWVIGSGTAGKVNSTNAKPTTIDGTLGRVVKIAGVVGGSTDSGADNELTVVVQPG